MGDRRPEKRRSMEGFQDRVLNILVNYMAQTSADLAYRYLFKHIVYFENTWLFLDKDVFVRIKKIGFLRGGGIMIEYN